MEFLSPVFFILVLHCSYFITFIMGDVMDLSDGDFNRLNDYDMALVMFYTPWCGHCQQLKPQLEIAGANLDGVAFVKVDCESGGKETCYRYNVGGYPTVKVFRRGHPLKDYSGSSEAAGMIKYMQVEAGIIPYNAESLLEDSNSISGNDGISIGGYFPKELPLKGSLQLTNKMGIFYTAPEEIPDVVQLFRPKFLENMLENNIVNYVDTNQDRNMDNRNKE